MKDLVGMIGMGVMGSAMTRNLRGAGFTVTGYDPSPAAADRARADGVEVLDSPRAVAERCGVVFFSLPSANALAQAIDGPTGVAAASTRDMIGIECSTLSLEVKKAARETLAAQGKILLDCPLSGTGAQAVLKDLVVFASGDRMAFDRVLPVLEGMSRSQKYLGPFGNGTIMKLVANHLVTIHNVAAAEAMVLGMKAGIDPAVLYDTLADSAGASRMLQVRGPMMRDGDYSKATATIRTHLKDLALIGAFANDLECPTPLFAAAAQPYYAGAAQGRALEDTAAVCAVLEDAARLERRAAG